MEKTLIILKPDTISRAICGEIISRFEKKGLKIIACKMAQLNEEILNDHYSHLKNKPFFPIILKFMTSAPVIIMVLEGKDAVEVVRNIVGPTNSRKASAGTIRGDFSNSGSKNVIHASDSIENAEIEIKRFFKLEEIYDYTRSIDSLIYAEDEV